MPTEKRATLPPQSPRTWHGMTAGVWFPLLARGRFAVSPWRAAMALGISGVSLVNSGLRLASEGLYARRARELTIEHPPIFVIGHWRTGTTWLHELLVKDERFSFPTTYQCMAPHHFLLTQRVLAPCLNWLMPSKRPMDDMPVGMSRPQEDEFALMNLGAGSPYLDWAFPNRHDYHDEYLTLDGLSEPQLQQWKDEFAGLVRRLTLADPRRLVLKSPTHTARVATLLEVFPEARFVHVVRNPWKAIPSTIRTWERMTDAMSLQIRRDPVTADRILDVFQRMYQAFHRDLPAIPADHLYLIRYEDLVKDPLGQMERIYSQLDLGDFQPARPAMEAYLASIAGYQPNRLDVPDDLRAQIALRCRDYIERYGYAEVAAR
jgi:hypothetical protein